MLSLTFVYHNKTMIALKLLCSLSFLFQQLEIAEAAPQSNSSSPAKSNTISSPTFTDEERLYIVDYWNQPGRYQITSPKNVTQDGPWQVRLSAEGSTWLWNYNKARNVSAPPIQIPKPQNEEQKAWDNWIDKKIAYDQWSTFQSASNCNQNLTGNRGIVNPLVTPATHPGPIPDGLLKLAGNPPCLVSLVAPKRYMITFDPQTTFEYVDETLIRLPRFAYFRFHTGVNYRGKKINELSEKELETLFLEANYSVSEQKIIKAISLLEGGFSSINTYDTGYISVGFLQFASLKNGDASLATLLIRHKTDDPHSFYENFHLFGIDIDNNKCLTAIDPATGAELHAEKAVLKIVEDKRLTAVFQRAATSCRPFIISQLKVAKQSFYPGHQNITVNFGNKTVTVKISDFIHSEAGMATLMDRKVNLGNLNKLKEVLDSLIKKKNILSAKELSKYEQDIIKMMTYRKNFMMDISLSQP